MHNLLIECGHSTSEELMLQWAAVCEGLVEYNAHYFADNPRDMDMPIPRYEMPREVREGAKLFADQALGSAPVIKSRGRATCFDWCCCVAGLMRAKGQEANCILIPVIGEYGEELSYRYHALVELVSRDANGNVTDKEYIDATQDLPGYQGTEKWWEDHGHCCMDCALGVHATEQPCMECEQAQAAGCATGTCGLKARNATFKRKGRR